MGKKMLKITALLLALVMTAAFALTGCGEDKENKKDDPTASPSATEAPVNKVSLEMAEEKPLEFLSAVFENTAAASSAAEGVTAEEFAAMLSKAFSVQLKMEPTSEEYEGEYADIVIHVTEDGKGSLSMDVNAEGSEFSVAGWLAENGVIVSCEDLGGENALLTEDLLKEIMGVGESDTETADQLDELKKSVTELSEKIKAGLKLWAEGEKAFKSEAAEYEIDGKKVPAIKVSYSLDKYTAMAAVDDLFNKNGEEIQKILDSVNSIAASGADYGTETISASTLKDMLTSAFSWVDSMTVDIAAVVIEETGCLAEITVNGKLEVAESEITDGGTMEFSVVSDSDNAGVTVEMKSGEGEDATVMKVIYEAKTEGQVLSANSYWDVTENGETERIAELTATYNLSDKKFLVEIKAAEDEFEDGYYEGDYEAVPYEAEESGALESVLAVSGTVTVTEKSFELVIEKIESDGEDMGAKLTVKITADAEMPKAPEAAVTISDAEAFYAYIETLDEEKLAVLSEFFEDEEYYGEESVISVYGSDGNVAYISCVDYEGVTYLSYFVDEYENLLDAVFIVEDGAVLYLDAYLYGEDIIATGYYDEEFNYCRIEECVIDPDWLVEAYMALETA